MPTASTSSAREILTGLHDVMASRSGAQAKLNKVVKIIAEAMASEVCSIYLLRDGLLELYATVGLNQSAVHVTKPEIGRPSCRERGCQYVYISVVAVSLKKKKK